METKTVQLNIPEYLTIGQYMAMQEYKLDDKWGRIINTISVLTGKDEEEVKYWSVDSLKKVYGLLVGLTEHNNEFHSLLEWDGKLYGYSHMKQMSLGEYIDLENLCTDVNKNLNKIAALLYRPITKHRFNSLKFLTKNAYKVVVEKDVENVFDWYSIEQYDSTIRKEREEDFKEFPITAILGALSFFLTSASLYLNSIVSSEIKNPEMKKEVDNTMKQVLESLSQSIGAGGGLSIHSVNPHYYRLQETEA